MADSNRIEDASGLKVVLASNFIRDERLGSSKVPLRLATELTELGARVTSLFESDLPQVPNARLSQLTSPIRMALAVASRSHDADIVDIAGWDAWPYARWARRKRPQQIIVSRSNGLWCRSLPFKGGEGRSRLRRAASAVTQAELCRWERSSIREADLAVFGARSDADFVVEHGWKPAQQVAVISPGIDGAFASDVPLETRSGVFYVGSYLHQKGGDVAADALAMLMPRWPNLTVTFVGPGVPRAEILSRFDPSLQARVRILEKVPASEVARELSSGAVLLFPALYEGFGMVVLEAMCAGLVAVATRTGAGAEIVRDGQNGLNVPFSDARATASAVERLLADPALRVRLAAAALAEARGRSWRVTARRLVEAYRRARETSARATGVRG
jgi:glycosyltransferase involved in cell wall biosynthesis